MDHYEHGGLTFDVRDRGLQDGEAVVLLHGFPQDGSSWSLVEPALGEAGLRTLAPDLRGYSPRARVTERSGYTSGKLMGDVLALLDAAGLSSAHVAGHDLGGNLAWMVASTYPERVRSLIALSTPHPAAMAKSFLTSSQAFRSWYMLLVQLPWLPEFGMSKGDLAAGLRRGGLPGQAAEHSAQRMREPNALRCALNWYRGIPLSLKTSPHRTRVPTTYIWGRRDPFLGRAAAELTQHYVQADYRFVDLDAGHWLPDTHAAQVSSEILHRVRAA